MKYIIEKINKIFEEFETDVFYTTPFYMKHYNKMMMGPFEILVNPTMNQVKQLEKDAMTRKYTHGDGRTENAYTDDKALIRIVTDDDSNIYVANGNVLLHDTMIDAVKKKYGKTAVPAGKTLYQFRQLMNNRTNNVD